ncbi:hypothetical protein L211DRAFT_184208 [Terfezia boudieri ATCC MYA-4762]|uniref:Uncharacterized protein n=1 Tax=Terfezia boudieri ATCC MYA-4762 TaxID=1051890 RepID=A0A3N4LN61_9PEZI|nr:hypothetical protein L211DRAFT_184208 [Terfezia boudieri ATCC MYA-4762]
MVHRFAVCFTHQKVVIGAVIESALLVLFLLLERNWSLDFWLGPPYKGVETELSEGVSTALDQPEPSLASFVTLPQVEIAVLSSVRALAMCMGLFTFLLDTPHVKLTFFVINLMQLQSLKSARKSAILCVTPTALCYTASLISRLGILTACFTNQIPPAYNVSTVTCF